MKGNLLLIDDEVALLENMKELLEDEADQIFTACNGAEALALIENHRIDCIVSDVRMPVMDGLTFLQKARARGFETPVIFYSGHSCDKLRAQTQALGARDCLTKPNFADLEELIRRTLKQELLPAFRALKDLVS